MFHPAFFLFLVEKTGCCSKCGQVRKWVTCVKPCQKRPFRMKFDRFDFDENSWNPNPQAIFYKWMEMVISNHFPYKDLESSN